MFTQKFYGETIAAVLVVTILSFSQTGCSSTISVVAEQASRADDIHRTTEVAYLWGLVDRVQGADCGGHGMQIVSARTNWFYSLCSVLTVGAVVPLTVEYRCTSTPLQDGGEIGHLMEEDQ